MMEEHQFLKLLELFPVLRSSTYCAEDDEMSTTTTGDIATTSGRPGKSSANAALKDGMDFEKSSPKDGGETLEKEPHKSLPSVSPDEGFWDPLVVAMQARLGDGGAQLFAETFRKFHETLVMKTLSLDDIERIATHMKARPEHF